MTPDELPVESASVYPYSDELIVELTATDERGDLVVVSYQFQYESGTDAVEPKQSVDTAFGDEVSTALAANGYQWVPKSGE